MEEHLNAGQVIPVHTTEDEVVPTNPGGNNPDAVPAPAAPVSGQVSDPHPVDEDPEEHVGRRRKDPWTDDKQEDWPNNDAELADSDEGDKS